jgi:hypothetical protein
LTGSWLTLDHQPRVKPNSGEAKLKVLIETEVIFFKRLTTISYLAILHFEPQSLAKGQEWVNRKLESQRNTRMETILCIEREIMDETLIRFMAI